MYKNFNITNYGEAMQFALEVFKFLNGKINYVTPANCLIFGNPNMEGAYGDTILDIVEINIHNICSDMTINNITPYDQHIKGFIVYTIIHELLHLDQNMWLYEQLTNNDLKKADELIETSAHAMTHKLYNMIIDGQLLPELDIKDIAIPSLLTFTNIKDEDTDQKNMWINSYYRVSHPNENALYYLNYLTFVDFLYSVQKENFTNIILKIIFNDILIGSDYIYYLNNWMYQQIFNLLRPIAFLKKATTDPLEMAVIDSYKTVEENIITGIITLDIHVNAPLSIVTQNYPAIFT